MEVRGSGGGGAGAEIGAGAEAGAGLGFGQSAEDFGKPRRGGTPTVRSAIGVT